MVDHDLVAAKLAELADRLGRIRSLVPEDRETLHEDRDRRELLAFNLMLAVQSSLDLANHLIADAGWPVGTDMATSFRRLTEHGVLAADTAETMARAAGLRNVLAHVYADVDLDLLLAAARRAPQDLERFSAEISRWVKATSASGTEA